MRILVDGSNVLFWRGGCAQAEVPALVVRALIARRFAPVLYFDNSIQRHLTQEHLARLASLAPQIIAPAGTSADAMLLGACDTGRLQIVSADRFRGWRRQYPSLRNDWLVTGRIEKGGGVNFSKKLKSAPL
jgi:hypothetical protein